MPSKETPVSWGVLGTADIALRKVIPAMKKASLTDVVAIASRSAEKAEQAAAQLGIPHAYDSYEALLADTSIEAVYIPLPNHIHADWSIKAASAGKHVLCEKPMALTVQDARGMIDACEAAGVKLMEAFMYRLHPMWLETKRIVESGEIGDLMAVQAVFSYFNDDPHNIRNILSFGGGALFDVGCYPVNASRMLFKSEPSVIHAAVKRDPRFKTDILTSAVLDFDGRHASFTCSTQMEPDQRVDIIGTAGRIHIDIPFNIPPDRTTRLQLIAGGDPPVAPGTTTVEFEPADQYTVQTEAFSRAIRLDNEVPTPPSDAVANLAVIEAILETGT